MKRSLQAALLGCGVLAAMGASQARAEGPACAGIQARWESTKADLQTPQISALLFAAADNGCPAVAETLLAAGALIEAKDRFGNTPLAHAARAGQIEMLQTLLAHGADIGHQNISGSSALFSAIERHQPAAAAFLLAHGADPRQPGRSGVTPLAAAAFVGDDATTALLLMRHADPNTADSTGKTPIVYAAGNADLPIVKRLLASGVEVNARYGNDLTALMWAAGYADGATEANGIAVVSYLLDHGAHVDETDNRGQTALMIAAERGHAAIAKLLLARGANPAIKNQDGKTARDLATLPDVKQVFPAAPG